MPSPEERRRGDGVVRTPTGRYMARFRMADGRQRSRTFDTLADARAWKAEREQEVRRQGLAAVDPRLARTPLAVPASSWLASKASLEVTTRLGYSEVWRTLVAPRFARTPVGTITQTDAQEWVAGLLSGRVTGKPLSRARTRKALLVLKQILGQAVADGMIAASPVTAQVRVTGTDPADIHPLTHGQVDALAGAMPTADLSLLVTFMAYTGLRVSEVSALRSRDVNLARGRVTVRAATVEVTAAGVPLVEKGTKTHAVRTVPVPGFLTDRLAAHLRGKRPGDRVFVDDVNGGPVRGTRLTKLLGRASTTAGLPERVRTKDLRDTAASLSIQAGASVRTVSALLGHASPVMTLTRYAGLFEDDLDVLADRLTQARGTHLA